MSSQPTRRAITCLAGLIGLGLAASAEAILINEIRIDQPGADRDEYFELAGLGGESLDGLSYLVVGDSRRGKSGVIESVTRLDGLRIADDGLFLVAEDSFTLAATVDLVAELNFENGDNVTHLLVRDFSARNGDDLDRDDDGLLDSTPWSEILDGLALIASPGGGDKTYSETILTGLNGNAPAHAYREGTQQTWRAGNMSIGGDTAGLSNAALEVPEPGTLALLAAGLLGWRHRSRQGHR